MSEVYKRYTSGRDIFHPWHRDQDISQLMHDLIDRRSMTLVDWDRMWTLKWAFRQTQVTAGEVWELGVYRGGSALMLKRLIMDRAELARCTTLRLFDSFEGLPEATKGVDLHSRGEFADTSLEEVKSLVGDESFIDYRKGWIPHTFSGLDRVSIRLAHIDLDLYQPILDACAFVYPRLAPGGVIVFDDYGFDSCPGARKAVDEFFANEPETPLGLPTGQAILIKHPATSHVHGSSGRRDR